MFMHFIRYFNWAVGFSLSLALGYRNLGLTIDGFVPSFSDTQMLRTHHISCPNYTRECHRFKSSIRRL